MHSSDEDTGYSSNNDHSNKYYTRKKENVKPKSKNDKTTSKVTTQKNSKKCKKE